MRYTYALIFLASICVWGQNKPNYSGTWKLDPLRSRSEAVKQPKELVLKIQHNEPDLRLEISRETDGGEQTDVVQLKTDGNPVAAGDSTASAHWDQWNPERLVLRIERRTPTGPVTLSREIRLGEKGKTLTTILTAKEGSGEKKAYEFYVKE
jgi:hypothetical protein